MLRSLKQKGEEVLLHRLQEALSPTERAKGQKHCFWKDTFDVKECRTEKFLLQKLQYIHSNPVSGKWKLAPSAGEYLHSSASFYFYMRQPLFEVVHYEKLLNWEAMYE